MSALKETRFLLIGKRYHSGAPNDELGGFFRYQELESVSTYYRYRYELRWYRVISSVLIY